MTKAQPRLTGDISGKPTKTIPATHVATPPATPTPHAPTGSMRIVPDQQAHALMSGHRDRVHLFALSQDFDGVTTKTATQSPVGIPDGCANAAPSPRTAFSAQDFMTQHSGGAWPLRDALGVDRLDGKYAELVDVMDLAGLGLTGYLSAGIGVDPAQIAPDRARIDALTGTVVILRAAGFDGAHVTITPRPPLRHVGTWDLIPAASTMEPLRAQSATGTLAPPARPASQARAFRYTGWIILGAILLGLLALTAFGVARQ